MLRIQSVREMALLAACVIASTLSFAQETVVDRQRIQKQIAKLRQEYTTALDADTTNDELRNLLRDLNGATSQGDWERAAKLLHEYLGEDESSSSADGTAADSMTDLWPVRSPEAEAVDDKPFTMEKEMYEGVGGLKLGALLYRPKDDNASGGAPSGGKAPVIVLAHGGMRGVPLAYRRIAEALVKVGYIVYVPEFRGQGRSAGRLEYGGGEVLDLLSAIEVVKALEGVDANRIGIVAGGHGGLVALIALARAEGVKCAVTLSAPTDLAGLVRESPIYKRELTLHRVPISTVDQNVMRQRSPLFYASGIQIPVMVMHGEKDVMVPVKFAEGYAGILKARGKDVTFLTYVTAGQNLATKLSMYHVDMQNYLATYLKPPGWKIIKNKQGRGNEDGEEGSDKRRRRRRN